MMRCKGTYSELMMRLCQISKLALTALILLVWTQRVVALTYIDPSDYAAITSALPGAPTDLTHPDPALMAKVGASGVMIAPDWILCAGHAMPSDTYEININDNPYKAVQGHIIQHPNYPTTDLALVQIQTLDNQTPNLPYVRIADYSSLLPGELIAVGGFGRLGRNIGGDQDEYYNGGGTLSWGRNILSSVSSSDLGLNLDPPSSTVYIEYEAKCDNLDSGGGWFVRDGWEWKLAGTTDNRTVATSFTSDVATWIQQTTGNILPPYTPAPIPSPTIAWIGTSSQSWGIAGNWQPTRMPDPTDTVSISSQAGPKVDTGVTAKAGDLFIVPPSSSTAANMSVEGGSLEANSIFVGVDGGGFGSLTMNSGTVTAQTEYIGKRNGTALVVQYAGSNTADAIHVGQQTGVAYYVMQASSSVATSPKVKAASVIIGGGGSTGHFRMLPSAGNYAELATGITTIGSAGNFVQSAGTHNVASELIVGYGSGSPASYTLSGSAELNTAESAIGVDGPGSFVQSGGTHTTTKLTVGPSPSGSYSLTSGILKASVIDGTITFGGLPGTTTVAGYDHEITDYRKATFENSQLAHLAVGNESLVLISAPWLGTYPSTAVAPHQVGPNTTLTIGGRGIRTHGTIPDPIELTDGGYLIADNSGNETIVAEQGITVTSGSAVIAWEDGANGIQVKNGSGIVVNQGASLKTRGALLSSSETPLLTVYGNLSLGTTDSNATTDSVTLYNQFEPTHVGDKGLWLSTTAHLTMRIGTAQQSDYIRNVAEKSQIDGSLTMQFVASYQPMPSATPETFTIIEAPVSGDYLSGHFASSQVATSPNNTILVNDPTNPNKQIAMAVLYCDATGYCGQGGTPVAEGQVSKIMIRPTLPGDLNLDNQVTAADYSTLLSNYNQPGFKEWIQGDINGDGTVTAADYSLLLGNFGSANNWPLGLEGGGGIPEPHTILLTVIALIGGAMLRNRSK